MASKTVVADKKKDKTPALKQIIDFRSGNEAAALAGKHINFHLMGYYPITPSTEVAENLDAMKADGEHEIKMVPADGEHGAAGICFGVATGGGRVLNVTSSQGILYSMEELPVQSGTRLPMVLNVAARTVSGPLDIRGDHSDIYAMLNCGWVILMAPDPQAVYDMNFIAVRIGEHANVRLPTAVAYDGFFTSHQKRRIYTFESAKAAAQFIGKQPDTYHTLDPRKPITVGPYMNDPDLINNKYQLHRALKAALDILPGLFDEYAELTGRRYSLLDLYRMEDAQCALVLLNSAAETAKAAADNLRKQGRKVGVISPRVIRPFPVEAMRQALKNIKAVLIGDRADSYGSDGGNIAHEVKSALKDDPQNKTLCLSRVYGLGGRDFYGEDAEAFFKLALEAASKDKVDVPFDYYGAYAGKPGVVPKPVIEPITKEETTKKLVRVKVNPETGRLDVEMDPLWKMVTMPNRVAPGHGACPGCGIFSSLRQFFLGIEGNVVVLFHTGCAMVVTTGYPRSAHRVTYVHNLFQSGAPTLSGLVEMYHERVRRGELPKEDDFTFIMVSGDGGMDIGMGPVIGTANRNHKMIILEYDNQAYMNTGAQLSFATPIGQKTSTSNVGPKQIGKAFHHKDTVQLLAATHIPYVFSAVEGYPEDFIKKAAKAQWYAKNVGMAFGKVLSFCPLNWIVDESLGTSVTQAAAACMFYPLYEVELGKTTITYDPETVGRRIPVKDYLGMMGKTKHLLAKGNESVLKAFEAEVERRWLRLKAMHDHPLL
ncbi:MAG: pyruvate synthase [Elusimicrobia bacterium]|nr:pyruvate synthase [Elusimicrobiota bacterium]